MYYYSPPPEDGSCLVSYVPVYLIGLMLAIGRVAEALLNPFIGDWSDKTNTKMGTTYPLHSRRHADNGLGDVPDLVPSHRA